MRLRARLATALPATAWGIANAATRSAIEGSSFGDNLIAAIPDVIGQVAGGALGRSVGSVWGDQNHTGFLGLLQDFMEAPTKIGATVGAKIGDLVESGVNGIWVVADVWRDRGGSAHPIEYD